MAALNKSSVLRMFSNNDKLEPKQVATEGIPRLGVQHIEGRLSHPTNLAYAIGETQRRSQGLFDNRST